MSPEIEIPITLNAEQAREIALSIEKINQLAFMIGESAAVLKEACLDTNDRPLVRKNLVDIIDTASSDIWSEHLEAINERLWGSHLTPYAFGLEVGFKELEFSLTEAESDDEETVSDDALSGGES